MWPLPGFWLEEENFYVEPTQCSEPSVRFVSCLLHVASVETLSLCSLVVRTAGSVLGRQGQPLRKCVYGKKVRYQALEEFTIVSGSCLPTYS